MVTVCPSQFATRRTLFHVLVGCGLLMLKVSRLKLPVIWLLVSMLVNKVNKKQIRNLLVKVLEAKEGTTHQKPSCRYFPRNCSETEMAGNLGRKWSQWQICPRSA